MVDTFSSAFAAPLEPSRSTWLVRPDLDRATAIKNGLFLFSHSKISKLVVSPVDLVAG